MVFPATPFLQSELDALVAIAVELVLGDCPLDRTSSRLGDVPLSGLPVGLLRPLRRDDIYIYRFRETELNYTALNTDKQDKTSTKADIHVPASDFDGSSSRV